MTNIQCQMLIRSDFHPHQRTRGQTGAASLMFRVAILPHVEAEATFDLETRLAEPQKQGLQPHLSGRDL